MLRQLSMLVALFMSSGLISIGHGALGALIIQQGVQYGFSDTFLGLLITITYIGFVAGNYLFSWLLPRISYIRTFAICAAVMTVGTLLLPLLPTKIAWIILRLLHGLFFSTSVVICESWLNSTVDNRYRGTLHATMMTVNYIAYGASQYILLLGGDTPFPAFTLVAIFLVISLTPICMTRFAEPQHSIGSASVTKMKIIDAYRVAPMAYLAHLGNGLTMGALWLFVRYAESVTDSIATASTLAALFFGSGFLLQMPAGWLSDRMRDRRTMIAYINGVSALLAGVLFFGKLFSSDILTIIVLAFGMISATAFSLNIAYGQDFAGRERASEYAGRLFQPYAAGAVIGPAVVGVLMDHLSESWLFAFVSAIYAAVTVMCLTSRFIPHFVPVKQGTYQVATTHTPTVSKELPEFNELDIGPDLPEEQSSTGTGDSSFIGPQQAETKSDSSGGDFTGPLPPATTKTNPADTLHTGKSDHDD